MAVRIRLMRMGKKKQPTYRVVVVDGRKPRDGKYIELIGRYDPRQEPSLIEIDNERALDWLHKGAQPSDTAKKLLTISGAWTRFQVSKGLIPTLGDAPTPAEKAPEPVMVIEPTPEPVVTEPTPEEAEADAAEGEIDEAIESSEEPAPEASEEPAATDEEKADE